MEVWGINDLGAAAVGPDLLEDGLTVRAVAVAAGVAVEISVAAVIADADIEAASSGLAAHDGQGRLVLDFRGGERVQVLSKAVGKNLLDFRLTHGMRPPSGRTGSLRPLKRRKPDGHKSWWNSGIYGP